MTYQKNQNFLLETQATNCQENSYSGKNKLFSHYHSFHQTIRKPKLLILDNLDNEEVGYILSSIVSLSAQFLLENVYVKLQSSDL